jgi:hypothetical protein
MAGSPVHQSSAAIAAAGSARPLSGDPIERLSFDGYVVVGINGSAAGLVAAITIGGVTEVDSMQVNALNRFPVLPDDLIVVNSLAPAGQLNRVFISNPTAGALTHFTFARASVFPYNR